MSVVPYVRDKYNGRSPVNFRTCTARGRLFCLQSDEMAGRKRRFDRSFSSSESSGDLSSSSTSDSKNSKRQVTVTTFEKWQRNYDRDHATLTWLKSERDKHDRSLVELLWCSACRQYKNRMKNLSNTLNNNFAMSDHFK